MNKNKLMKKLCNMRIFIYTCAIIQVALSCQNNNAISDMKPTGSNTKGNKPNQDPILNFPQTNPPITREITADKVKKIIATLKNEATADPVKVIFKKKACLYACELNHKDILTKDEKDMLTRLEDVITYSTNSRSCTDLWGLYKLKQLVTESAKLICSKGVFYTTNWLYENIDRYIDAFNKYLSMPPVKAGSKSYMPGDENSTISLLAPFK